MTYLLFFALKEEKCPLEIVQQLTNIPLFKRQHGQKKVLAAIKTCAAKLQPEIDTYKRNLRNYKVVFSNCPALRSFTFEELLSTKANDTFWKYSLFTYDNQPWAMNTPTQVGMCALAHLWEGNFEGVIAGVLTFYNIAPEFTHNWMALRMIQENIPEELEEDNFPEVLEDEEVEVDFEKFMHLDEIYDALQEPTAGDNVDGKI
ncbi:hypothetical protein DFH28DRAFT_1153524 [Melampsora americana]|nr:hypothetical protein DFH28DRAFT_1153524 [Melampsora americana]